MQRAPGSKVSAGDRGVREERVAARERPRARQLGHAIEREERQDGQRRRAELRRREGARGAQRVAREAPRERRAERDAGQEARQHGREAVDAAAEQMAEQARPQHLVAERDRAGDEHQRQDPVAGRTPARLRGRTSRRGRRLGAARGQHGRAKTRALAPTATKHRVAQSERRQQHEARGERRRAPRRRC